MSNYNSLTDSDKINMINELMQYYFSLPDKEEDYNMDYDTFLSFFDKLREEKDIKIGDYKVRYNESSYNLTSGSIETISYYRDGYMIGEDYIKEYYKLGDIMPTLDTSFDISGIKNYAKLKDYLDYLYETNIEELKRQEQERERELLERQREEELKEKKLNDFLDIN